MTKIANKKFENALGRIPQACPPVWLMRQAGRYHEHYQKLRKEHSFVGLCKNPKLAAETALGPIADFDFDVSILFSDLLFPLEAFGMGLKYDPAPELDWHLRSMDDFKKMRQPDDAIADMVFQKEAVEETRKVLPSDKSLIGFVGSPWTLFVYAVCGSHKGSLIEAKKNLGLFEPFCENFMMPLLQKNIQLQLDGGAEVVMVFDTAAGDLAPDDYESLVAPHIRHLAQLYPSRLGYYSKNTQASHLSCIWEGVDVAGIGYDHRWSLSECFARGPGFVQGNFDQSLLFCEPQEFAQRFSKYLEGFSQLSPQERAGWVCGLGHGVLPKTPVENVRFFVQKVREVFGG